jgi:superfamily II DNA helicase RecQ
MDNLKCIKCEIEKEQTEDNFYYRKDTNKWKPVCKTCLSDKNKKIYANNSEDIKTRCNVYRDKNRKVINTKAKIYNSKPDVKLRNKTYRQDNKVALRKKEKAWRLKNPEKHKEIARKKSQKQNKKPMSKIKHHISWCVSKALIKQNTSKANKSIINYLGYSIQELKEHLEKQFESWMTWDNYGVYKLSSWKDDDKSTWTWQIDHVIPHSTFKYISMKDGEFKKCWALENLRPYSAKQNVLDGANKTRH